MIGVGFLIPWFHLCLYDTQMVKTTTPFMVFIVTYYSELHNAIIKNVNFHQAKPFMFYNVQTSYSTFVSWYSTHA